MVMEVHHHVGRCYGCCYGFDSGCFYMAAVVVMVVVMVVPVTVMLIILVMLNVKLMSVVRAMGAIIVIIMGEVMVVPTSGERN